MTSMILDIDILEKKFLLFSEFIETQDGQSFETFSESKFVIEKEGYKYNVYTEAREKLGNKWWKQEDIGTGKIQNAVISAIQTKVSNNLINWREKDSFKKSPKKKSIENLFFDFYKSKRKNSECFEEFKHEGLSYQFIAYLFFIKEKNKFMPISQERFDVIFEILGVDNFKTKGNTSWENYDLFLYLIKQTQNFLKLKDKNTTLLDAHSFLWILGQIHLDYKGNETINSLENDKKNFMEKKRIEPSDATELNMSQWSEILLDDELTKELDLLLLQTLYSFPDYKASSSQIALILNIAYPQLNLEVGNYAKRIANKYNVNFTVRNERKYKYWDLFFRGWYEETKFIWQLKPNLRLAIENNNLIGGISYPDELSTGAETEFYEGLKKTITVNSYERNLKARELCIKHWSSKCAVCGFDFEKVYGKIGKDYIHVHHITPISQIGETYKIDPINDLIPICPNCHAMIHKKYPPYSIEEMKEILTKKLKFIYCSKN